MNDRKNFWWLFGEKERTYTLAEIEQLLDRIKDFNAGAVDNFLSRHVEHVKAEWLESKKLD